MHVALGTVPPVLKKHQRETMSTDTNNINMCTQGVFSMAIHGLVVAVRQLRSRSGVHAPQQQLRACLHSKYSRSGSGNAHRTHVHEQIKENAAVQIKACNVVTVRSVAALPGGRNGCGSPLDMCHPQTKQVVQLAILFLWGFSGTQEIGVDKALHKTAITPSEHPLPNKHSQQTSRLARLTPAPPPCPPPAAPPRRRSWPPAPAPARSARRRAPRPAPSCRAGALPRRAQRR